MATKVYVGDVGTEIILDCGTDISTATTTLILVKKPDKSEVQWTSSVDNTRYMKYTVLGGDFNIEGIYSLQAYVSTTAWSGRGETVTLTVYKKFT